MLFLVFIKTLILKIFLNIQKTKIDYKKKSNHLNQIKKAKASIKEEKRSDTVENEKNYKYQN